MDVVIPVWQLVSLVVGASGLVSAIVTLILKWIFQRTINAHVERLKHDLQKDAMSAQIAIGEKHKIYAELFRLVNVADGAVFNLFGLRRDPTYEEYGEKDFEQLFEKWNTPQGKAAELLETHRIDKEKAINDWKDYRRVLERGEARSAIAEARNYLLVNEIYIEDNIADMAHEIMTLIALYLTNAELNEDHRDPHLMEEVKKNQDRKNKVEELIPKLKSIMKKKLLG